MCGKGALCPARVNCERWQIPESISRATCAFEKVMGDVNSTYQELTSHFDLAIRRHESKRRQQRELPLFCMG